MTQRRSKESVRATGRKSRSKKQADAPKKKAAKRTTKHDRQFAPGNEYRFAPGNELWRRGLMLRRKYQDADSLLMAAAEYFEWADSNPHREEVAAQFQGCYVKDSVNKMRAYTVSGFCLHVGLARPTFYDMADQPEFADAIERIQQVISEQKFSGAAAGLLNPSIIARDLGLSDKLDATTTNAHVVSEAKTPEQVREHLTLFNQVLEKAVGNAS